ncbi:hypothetical protein EET67_06360 [Pseudaminobacter arsenicus]|uniref:Glycosyltransferase RgtA/B/C/D-like domain-containing protein n=1 Tax=Borborobacter arsenicus TaxID=1851146 RepID=A0A432V979_9HYPH|nr:hypothetical protein [Pseudaminobacter arsenicus]RUM98720.1 hypothetical protein EET67_06360 [Pseudaminobacter arsenicus]
MTSTAKNTTATGASGVFALLKSPLALLAIALLFVFTLLTLPIILPIGPMYWDVFLYYDAANRIFDGQVPVTDFFTPVGPLGYYLFAGWLAIFPNAQPVLLAHWSLLAVTAPLMALLVWHVDQRSRGTAFALLIPFLVFALLPFNTREFYPFPGSDGFGIYNRQASEVLYILVAALFFVRDRRLLTILITASMSALFFLKITGFVAGGIIAAYALLSGRVTWRIAILCSLIFFAVLAGIELSSGLASQYIFDIMSLVAMNKGTLLPRFLQATSLNFGIVATAGSLALLLLWSDRRSLTSGVFGGQQTSRAGTSPALLTHDGPWLLVVLFAGILFETQNTGSQALIFLWPVLLSAFLKTGKLVDRPILVLLIMALVAATALPPAVRVAERAARTYVGALKNVPLEHRNLKTLGAVDMRTEVATRTEHMLRLYPELRAPFEELVAAGELPTPMLYSDFDFQISYLSAVDIAIESIRGLEARRGIHFDTIMSLNFVNPFPWLMERSAPLYIAIGADPMRAVPDPGSQEENAVTDTDLVLYPTCPPTTANALLYDMYKDALTKHRRIRLDQCYDAFIHPKFEASLGSDPGLPSQ